jgi:hypothetical protein
MAPVMAKSVVLTPRRAVLVLGVAAVVASCGTAPVSGPPGTGMAFNQGCREGFKDGGIGNTYISFRDEHAYATDARYRERWVEGYRTCFDRASFEPRRR